MLRRAERIKCKNILTALETTSESLAKTLRAELSAQPVVEPKYDFSARRLATFCRLPQPAVVAKIVVQKDVHEAPREASGETLEKQE